MRTMSLFEAAAMFAVQGSEIVIALHEGLEKAAQIVEDEAKSEIGTYQGGVGGIFAGWQELADSTKADRVAQGFPENEPLLRTGEMRDSIDHSVEGLTALVGSDSDIALWQELGTDKIPPRSFLGGAAFRKQDEVAEIIGDAGFAVLAGGETKVRF